MFGDDVVGLIHTMNAEEEFLFKIESLNEEVIFLKYEKESLQDDCVHCYKKYKYLKEENKQYFEICEEYHKTL